MRSATPIRNLTAAARMGLSGHWKKAVGLHILFLFLLTGSTLGCVGWLFAGPLAVGFSSFFLTVQRGSMRVAQLFDGVNGFGRAFFEHLFDGTVYSAVVPSPDYPRHHQELFVRDDVLHSGG